MSDKKLLKTLRLFYLLCLPIGLSPYTITKIGKIKTNLKSVIKTFISFAYGFTSIYLRGKYLNESTLDYEGILKVVDIVSIVTWETFTLLFIIIEFFKRKEFCNILKNLQKFDTTIKLPQKCYQDLKNYITYSFITIFIIGTLTHFANFFVYHIANNESDVLILSVLAYAHLFFVLLVVIFKFLVLNFIIRQRLKRINQFLLKSCGKTGESKVRSIIYVISRAWDSSLRNS